MNVNPDLLFAFAGGLLTGAWFCAALWRSVRRLRACRPRAGALLMGSAARVAMVLAAFYLIGGLRPGATLAALAGFVIARMTVSSWFCFARVGREAAPAGRRS